MDSCFIDIPMFFHVNEDNNLAFLLNGRRVKSTFEKDDEAFIIRDAETNEVIHVIDDWNGWKFEGHEIEWIGEE